MGFHLLKKLFPPFVDQAEIESLCWHKTFDALPDFVSVLDCDFKFVRVNKALADFLQKPEEQLIGRHCYQLMHGKQSHYPDCPHAAMLQCRESVTTEIDDSYLGVPLLVTASPIFDAKNRLLGSIHIAKDISELKKTERALARRNQEQEALYRLSREALGNITSGSIIDLFLDHLMEVARPDQVFIYLVEGNELREVGVRPIKHFALPEKKLVGECLCGLAAGGSSIYSLDINGDDRCTLHECKAAGVRSFAALPLAFGNEVLGVIGMASLATRDFAEQKEFLETMAATIALIFKNSQMFQELSSSSQKMKGLIQERTAELEGKNQEFAIKIDEIERMNRAFVHRELRMVELKKKIKELEQAQHDSAGPDLAC